MHRMIAILVAATFLSCGTLDASEDMFVWTEKKIDTSELQRVNLETISQNVIDDVQADYRRNPVDSSYAELKPFSAFFDASVGQSILILDILYVDDVQVVYVFDGDGRVCDKYLHSAWN